MPRLANRLTDLKIRKLTAPGLHPDGAGLYLRITPGGAKGWILRYMLNKRPRRMGLGPYPIVGLAEARLKALDARRQRYEGMDPIEARRAQRGSQRPQAPKGITFREAAFAYIAAHRAGWKHPKHIRQWSQSLADHVYPVIGAMPVDAIDTAAIMRALKPIWAVKPETSSRVRGRIESVLDWARVHGYRTGENPARWKGHLAKLLPSKSKVKQAGHFRAMPYAAVPAFMARLRAEPGVAARALEFCILTAGRQAEVLGATWDEFDQNAGVWTIPPGRMKGRREHRVPLAVAAMAVLDVMAHLGTERVFPGITVNKIAHMLRQMHIDGTAHGFRSSFRDWAGDCTSFPRDVAEAALAHKVGNATEAAYRRSDALEKRRELMDAWTSFCAGGK